MIDVEKPARLGVRVFHKYCEDCKSECSCKYRDKIFKWYHFEYTCLTCGKKELGYIDYPLVQTYVEQL